MDAGESVEFCYIDFSKTFDSVNHRLLRHKLDFVGINRRIHRWLSAFLAGRRFSARIGEIPIYSGVPQGSILGPLLRMLGCPTFAFADYVKLVSSGEREPLVHDLEKL